MQAYHIFNLIANKCFIVMCYAAHTRTAPHTRTHTRTAPHTRTHTHAPHRTDRIE
jgi:hypothetical protein